VPSLCVRGQRHVLQLVPDAQLARLKANDLFRGANWSPLRLLEEDVHARFALLHRDRLQRWDFLLAGGLLALLGALAILILRYLR